MKKNQEIIRFLGELSSLAQKNNIDFWISGGWAFDGLIGNITREHDDLDVMVNLKNREKFIEILKRLGCVTRKIFKESVLALSQNFKIDVHFFSYNNSKIPEFDFGGEKIFILPSNSFDTRKVVWLESIAFKVVSWEALFVNKYYYKELYPREELRDKDIHELETIRQHIPHIKFIELQRKYTPYKKNRGVQ